MRCLLLFVVNARFSLISFFKKIVCLQNLSGYYYSGRFFLEEKSLKSKLIQITFKSFSRVKLVLDVRNKKLFNAFPPLAGLGILDY